MQRWGWRVSVAQFPSTALYPLCPQVIAIKGTWQKSRPEAVSASTFSLRTSVLYEFYNSEEDSNTMLVLETLAW